MTHVHQPWTVAATLGPCAEADSLRQLGEGVVGYRSGNPAPAFGEKKRGRGWCRNDVSSFGVLLQSFYCGKMNRHITRFSKLRPPDVKDAELEVDIRPVQTQGFVHPHPCRHQQAEKGRIGVGTETFGRGELLSSAKEPFNLFVAVDVRGLAAVTIREKSCGGNLGPRFDGAMSNGETADHA